MYTLCHGAALEQDSYIFSDMVVILKYWTNMTILLQFFLDFSTLIRCSALRSNGKAYQPVGEAENNPQPAQL
jgi:hypothetical protein